MRRIPLPWRELVIALDEPVRATGVTSLRSFYEEVLTSIDELAKQTGYAVPRVEASKPGDGMREQIFLPEDVLATETIAAIADVGYVPETLYETEPMPFEIEFHSAQSPGTRVNYVQNNQIKIQYINIDGPDAVPVRQALEKTLRHYDRSTSYERATSDPDVDERVSALFHLALARAPVPEAHVLRLIDAFLHESRDSVRHAAVLSIAYFEWPAAAAMLDDLIRRETNPEILADAKLLRGRLQLPPDRAPITGFVRLVVDATPQPETIWARRWRDGSWAISSIPQVAYNLSIGDVVEAEFRDNVWQMTRMRAKSGHRTLRVDIGTDPKRADDVEAACRQLGVRFETQQPGRVAVDVPPHVDIQKLARAFDGRGLSWEQTDPQPS